MKLEQQVVSLELSKRLRELGVKQDSVCYWREFQLNGEFDNQILWDVDTELSYRSTISNVLQSVAAFTVAELGEMLPNEVEINETSYWLGIHRGLRDVWIIGYRENGTNGLSFPNEAETEADARAKMLVYLLERGLITF
jgi:hypothetical protein